MHAFIHMTIFRSVQKSTWNLNMRDVLLNWKFLQEMQSEYICFTYCTGYEITTDRIYIYMFMYVVFSKRKS